MTNLTIISDAANQFHFMMQIISVLGENNPIT